MLCSKAKWSMSLRKPLSDIILSKCKTVCTSQSYKVLQTLLTDLCTLTSKTGFNLGRIMAIWHWWTKLVSQNSQYVPFYLWKSNPLAHSKAVAVAFGPIAWEKLGVLGPDANAWCRTIAGTISHWCRDLWRSWQSDSLRLWRRGFDPYRWRPRGVAVDPWVQNCLVG